MTSDGTARNEEELALLRRAAAGDRDAFRQLFVRYHGRLDRFLRTLTDDRPLVEELIDDTMLVVWRKAAQFGERSRLSTWIFGIAYRLAMKALTGRPARAIPPEPVTSQPSAQSDDLEDLVEVALRTLDPERRAVLELAYFMGYSCTEIAAIIDCPVNTVKTRLFHAREQLRALVPGLAQRAPSVGSLLE